VIGEEGERPDRRCVSLETAAGTSSSWGRVEAVVVISIVFPSTVKIGNIVNSLNEILWPLLWVGKKRSHGLTDFRTPSDHYYLSLA
jgi:hypothetical protein